MASGLTFSANAQVKPGLTNGEYRLLSKGEPMPYTGVAVGLSTYRAETAKFKAQAARIDGLVEEVAGLKKEIATGVDLLEKQAALSANYRELAVKADSAATETKAALVITTTAYEKVKPKWFEKPLPLIGSGFIIGLFVGAKYL